MKIFKYLLAFFFYYLLWCYLLYCLQFFAYGFVNGYCSRASERRVRSDYLQEDEKNLSFWIVILFSKATCSKQ